MTLEDVEQIKELKARYFRFFDTKQWDRWRGLFTDDCT
jgi:3-phenylpropionate/cinnamic acid dioxygenase small subunit